ncbi:hypothetical protein, partial [Fibrobacter succinogenes]|uniref:hypothetical protein n=1 Tax=Fibrobacter succinogenes TaxID=833 RepID=UPI0019D5B4E2
CWTSSPPCGRISFPEKSENGISAQEYMQQLTVAPNIVINMDQANNRYTAQSDGGKPAKVKVQNTPGMGR